MRTLPLTLVTIILSIHLGAQTAPDFELTDIEGKSHKLYEDYLDQGKAVVLLFGATWGPFDRDFLTRNILQSFYAEYFYSDQIQILYIESWEASFDELNGNGVNGYNYIEGVNFPIISTNEQVLTSYNIIGVPSIQLICPSGTWWSDSDEDALAHFNLESSDDLVEKIEYYCGLKLSTPNEIHVTSYSDEELDCTFNGKDYQVPHVKVKVSDGEYDLYKYTDDLGEVSFGANRGEYEVELTPPSPVWDVCTIDKPISFNNDHQNAAIELGIKANEKCAIIDASITATRLRRCFDNIKVYVDYCNIGTIPAEDAYLEVELDEYMSYKFSDPSPNEIIGNVLRYELGDVPILFCDQLVIEIDVDCEAPLEAIACYSVIAYPTEDCLGKYKPGDSECSEIRASFDPNDKRAFPLGEGDNYTVLPNDTIKYQIRFQNTGNDTAFTVVIKDVLSENLDLSTFEAGQSSHRYEVEIEARELTFRFDNIMLPDSNVNLVGSNGFVNYYIAQNPNLANGTTIENTAAIYFDYNDPVITNTTKHTIDDGISSTYNILDNSKLKISPNPNMGEFNIHSEKDLTHSVLKLYDLNGRLIQSSALQRGINKISSLELAGGLYLAKLEFADGSIAMQRLVIE